MNPANSPHAACPHRQVVLVTTGGMHFSQGDVWDDIHEHLLCLDCLEYLEPEASQTDQEDASISSFEDVDF